MNSHPTHTKLALCGAHVRRKFDQAEPHYERARIGTGMIAELYKLDAGFLLTCGVINILPQLP